MLPKENRIKKKKDFETIFKKSKTFKNNLFNLKILNNNLQISRFAIIVSNKVSKKAVERNKIRRRISSFLEKNIQNFKVGVDVVFIVLPTTNKKSFLEINESVKNILSDSKLL